MSPPAAWNANHPKPHNTANTTANIRNMGSPFPSFEQRSWRASFRLSWEEQGVCQVQRQGKRERLRPSRNCCPKNTRCGLHAVKICADRARGVDRASRPRQVSPDLGQLHVLVGEASSRRVIRAVVFLLQLSRPSRIGSRFPHRCLWQTPCSSARKTHARRTLHERSYLGR